MSTRSHVGSGLSVRLAVASVVLSAAASAFATDRAFTGAPGTPADYNTAGNWDPAGVPVAGDKFLIFGGRIATFTGGTDAATSGAIGANGATDANPVTTNPGTGELRISGGSLSLSADLQLGRDAGSTGRGLVSITGGSLSASAADLGENGTGDNRINISAGSLSLPGESYLGANGNGTLALSGTGDVSAGRINVGNGKFSTGALSMTGGTLAASVTVVVGARGLGTYTQSGGTATLFRMTAGLENDGVAGNPSGDGKGRGTVAVSGGSLSIAAPFVLGEISREDNQLNVSGSGTVNAGSDLYAGSNGRGTVNLSGTGTITVGSTYHVAAGPGSIGAFTMTGGTFKAGGTNNAGGIILIGQYGVGTLNLSGGAISTQRFSTGQDETGTGTAVQTGGSVRSTNTFIVGESTKNNNTYSISGGSIDIGTLGLANNGAGIFIGSGRGTGTMNVSGTASVSVRNGITIGNGGAGIADGTLNISGGTFTTVNPDDDGRVRIGLFNGSTGRLNVSGGIATFGGPILNGVGFQDPSSFNSGTPGGTGLITVSGGTLTSAGLENLAGSTYTQTGGTATLGTVVGNGAMAVSGGTTNVARITQQSLSVTGTGTVKVAVGDSRTASIVGSLTTAGTGKLDLGNNGLVIDYSGSVAANSPIQSVRAAAAAGRLAATLTPADPRQAIAYAEASTLGVTSLFGTPVDSTAVIIRTRLKGDTDFSGVVDFTDLVKLAQNYLGTNRVYTDGDFDFTGTVDFNDLVALAQNYLQPGTGALSADIGSTQFQADFRLAQSLVPEPTAALALASAIGLLGRRRRSV